MNMTGILHKIRITCIKICACKVRKHALTEKFTRACTVVARFLICMPQGASVKVEHCKDWPRQFYYQNITVK
jgi:hypothetical protein